MSIYIANIFFKATEDQLRQLFEEYGAVKSCRIILDKETGKSRGFAFVEMEDFNAAKKAMDELDGYDFQGRELVVNEAKQKVRGDRR